MAIKAKDIEILHQYAQGVMERSEHHAKYVGVVALTLIGGVIWKAMPGSIEIRTHKGSLANMVWWKSEDTNKKYAISYNHDTLEIEIRGDSAKGEVLFSLSNSTKPEDVLKMLSQL
ncbi:hypothetical protein IM264_18160 [Enterobacter cloacae complex sp. P34C]|uniref:hypothetical protein n=1 Tax=unclassified Enterobacter cloacae complex TaxID=2757714 RepID=UPI0018669851|nr:MULTISPECIES: hypothetical protein [unclassified Enterobacter cloacae complex]MBE3264686.1 hypothetical protein [Enterobacter cloacae complex sp. P34C]MBE3284962.1 hypothetical protein [Enterobacter cloacae complex sp. P33B]